MILTREHQVGSVVLQCDVDPVGAVLCFLPYETANPRRTWSFTRRAGVSDARFYLFANLLSSRKPDPYLAVLKIVFDLAAALRQFADRERRVEIEYDNVRRDHRSCDHHRRAGYRFRPGIDAERNVVTLHVIRRLFEHQRAAGRGRANAQFALGKGRDTK